MSINYDITHDPIEMISGTKNSIDPVYKESVRLYNESSAVISPMQRKFITRISKDIADIIPKLNSDNNDISKSKGDFLAYKDYKTISDTMEILTASKISIPDLKHIHGIIDALVKYKSEYMQAYTSNKEIIKLEYESAVYMVLDGISNILSNNIDMVVNNKNTIEMKSKQSIFKPKNVISKTIRDLDKELNHYQHHQYLKDMLQFEIKKIPDSEEITEGSEEVLIESVSITDFMDAIASIVGTFRKTTINITSRIPAIWSSIKRLFSILPVIRTCIYIHYYNKAQKIQKIEQQIGFIELNISKLKNKTDISKEEKEIIIKKQMRKIEAYRKRCEKLRAELVDAEKEAAKELNENNKNINSSDDDDLELV